MKNTPNQQANLPSIASKNLWCGQLEATAAMYWMSDETFELYLSIGRSVPKRHVGTLGEMNNRFDLWLSQRKSEGFEEQLPSFNPDAWRA